MVVCHFLLLKLSWFLLDQKHHLQLLLCFYLSLNEYTVCWKNTKLVFSIDRVTFCPTLWQFICRYTYCGCFCIYSGHKIRVRNPQISPCSCKTQSVPDYSLSFWWIFVHFHAFHVCTWSSDSGLNSCRTKELHIGLLVCPFCSPIFKLNKYHYVYDWLGIFLLCLS